MGVSIIDQKPLYSAFNENIGTIHFVPVYTKTLPEGVWAAFDVRTKPVGSGTSYTWADQSENEHDMAITIQVPSGTPAALWDDNNKCLRCGAKDRLVWGKIVNASLVSGKFTPANGYTFNMLCKFNGSSDERTNPYGSVTKNGDRLFAMKSGEQFNYHILSYNSSGVANGALTFGGHNSSTGSGFGNSKTAPSSDVHLVTWLIKHDQGESNNRMYIYMYVDGVQQTLVRNGTEYEYLDFSNDYSVYGTTPDLYFFGNTDDNPYSSGNVWHFFGDCYAISLYNSVLTQAEITQCVEFYQERYGYIG